MSDSIALIVGLGNPGQQYQQTRHNAGAWYVQRLAEKYNAQFKDDPKYHGLTCRITIKDQDVRLLIPTTFMNNSGQATSSLANFFKIQTEQLLVAHDELDLLPGVAKLKIGGGHGGHNGLRDIISCHANNKQFMRLRIGIGHPGSSDKVSGFVLSKASTKEQDLMDLAIDKALSLTNAAVDGNFQRAMNKLNGFNANTLDEA